VPIIPNIGPQFADGVTNSTAPVRKNMTFLDIGNAQKKTFTWFFTGQRVNPSEAGKRVTGST
jgi:hypothetical protein